MAEEYGDIQYVYGEKGSVYTFVLLPFSFLSFSDCINIWIEKNVFFLSFFLSSFRFWYFMVLNAWLATLFLCMYLCIYVCNIFKYCLDV